MTFVFVSKLTNSLVITINAVNSLKAYEDLDEKIEAARSLGIELPRPSSYEMITK